LLLWIQQGEPSDICNNRISDQTVCNRLRQSGLRSRGPLKGMELKRRHRIARLQWAHAHLLWRRNTWQNILFSDESKLNLKCCDGRVRIYRRPRKRFTDGCAKETVRFGGGGVMIWGGISQVGKTNLKIVVGNVNGIRYRYEILAPIVLPVIRTHHFNLVFQQDSARCHISRVSMKFLNDNHIRTLPWSALSPSNICGMSLEDASVDELIPLNIFASFKAHSQMRGTTFHRHLSCVW
jgi:hypothetical protein